MTEVLTQYTAYLRALLKGDQATASTLLGQMPDGTWEGTGRLNMAVFGLAVQKRFSDDKSHGAVKAFVSDFMQVVGESDEKFKPLHVELLLRGFLGETDLYYEVPGDEANKIQPIAAYLMAVNLDLSADEVDALVDEALANV